MELSEGARTAIVVAVVGGVMVGVLVPLIRGVARWLWRKVLVPHFLAPLGRHMAGHIMHNLSGSIVDDVDERLAGRLAAAMADVTRVVDSRIDSRIDVRMGARFDAVNGRLDAIQSELTTNGGTSVKDHILATARRMESIDRRLTIEEMERAALWETLAAHDIDRRRGMEADDATTEIDLDDVRAESDGADGGY